MIQRKLGRGLDSLIESTEAGPEAESRHVECDRIAPNPYQPRQEFEESGLDELAASISEHGVLQPIVLRAAGEGFEIVAGERRLRACVRLGLERIPALVREVDDDRMLEIALVENLQREDLNPIEKAKAYRRYLDALELTHEEGAKRLGKERSTISNQLRLLELSEELREMVSRGTLRAGHARALLGTPDEERRRAIARRIVREGLSVRETERRIRESRGEGPERKAPRKSEKSAWFQELERRLRERYATKARIDGTRQKGKLTLEYYTMDELSRLLEMLLPE